MTDDEDQQLIAVHHGLKAMQYLMGEHTEMGILKPDYMYHLLGLFVDKLEALINRDGDYPEGSL